MMNGDIMFWLRERRKESNAPLIENRLFSSLLPPGTQKEIGVGMHKVCMYADIRYRMVRLVELKLVGSADMNN